MQTEASRASAIEKRYQGSTQNQQRSGQAGLCAGASREISLGKAVGSQPSQTWRNRLLV